MNAEENKILINNHSYPFTLAGGRAKIKATLGTHAKTVKLIFAGSEYELKYRIEKLRVWELWKPLRVWIYEYHSHKQNIFTYDILCTGGQL